MATTFRLRAGDGKGYQNRGSVLVNRTADGVLLDDLFTEIAEATNLWNAQRSAISSLVSFRTTRPGDAVVQNVVAERFEAATEFGVPQGISDVDYLKIGFTLRDADLALRATWKYLRDATAEQVTDRVRRIFEADNRLVNNVILNRLFSPTPEINDQMLTCYGLWNGDGSKPPAHLGKTFAGDHTHFLVTSSTFLDALEVEQSITHIREHGYGSTQSAQFLLFAHPEDIETVGMTRWRAGVEYRLGAPLPKFDFIVSSTAPAFLTNEHVQGETPPPEFGGINVLGSYGGALVLPSYMVPKPRSTDGPG